jgi:predicted AAA+ superfamily ATPase
MNFQNPWWVDKMSIYEDDQVKRALSVSPKFIIPPPQESVLLLGPRQVGKTTFLKTCILSFLERGVEPTKILFFSCETLRDREQLISLLHDYRAFINSQEAYVLLDEVTFVKEWNTALLHLINAGYLRNTLVFVSGSTSVSLRKETLPGRPIRKAMFHPMNFRVFYDVFYGKIGLPTLNILQVEEFYRSAVKLSPYLDRLNKALLEYVRRGGFPATGYVAGDPLNSLYETYKDAILSDLAKLGREERVLREVVEKIVDFYASRISENTIAKETSIGSHNTVASYLELLENLFVLRVFRKIENGRINYKSFKKVYFTDPFIYRAIKRYVKGSGYIEDSEVARIVEGVVGEHLAREYQGTGYTFFKGGREVDFLVDQIGVEVKWGKAKPGDLKLGRGYVLSYDAIGFEDSKAILPVSMFLYSLSSDKVFYDYR